MFSQLIESNSHAQELRRRSSFLVFTTASYVVLFAITGVVSIYAYDSHLEQQEFGVTLVMRPDELASPAPDSFHLGDVIADGPTTSPNHDKQLTLASLDNTKLVPEIVSAGPVVNGHLPKSGTHIDTNGGGTETLGSGMPGGGNKILPGKQSKVELEQLPPPVPTPTPDRTVKESQVIHRSVINSLAIYLPKPSYPPMARQIRLQGSVNVQVLIDETGKVVSAKAMSGHPFLIPESVRAATNARFTPATINGQPVKLSGVIVYNFVMQ